MFRLMTLMGIMILWVLMPDLSFAQNGMFIPFGQSLTEFEEYLETRDYVRDVQKPHPDTLINLISQKHWASYFFERGVLYSIEDVRIYPDEKVAEAVVSSCVDYLKMSKMRMRTLASGQGLSHYAIVEGDRIIELLVKTEGARKEKITTIHLKSTSRLYGPRLKTESYAQEIVKK